MEDGGDGDDDDDVSRDEGEVHQHCSQSRLEISHFQT